MVPVSGYIPYGNEQIHFLKYGDGNELVIALHGFADSACLFAPIANHLQENYTLISLDLPYHGDTVWTENKVMSKEDLVAIIHLVKDEYHAVTFSLLGYSIGGRLCLMIAELMPESVRKLTLIAPDGLKVNPYYYFFTRTAFGSIIFKHSLHHAERYSKVLNLLKQIKILGSMKYKFVMINLDTPEKRKKVEMTWNSLRLLIPRSRVLKKIITEYKLPVTIFMGSYDKVIPVSNAEQFKKGKTTVEMLIFEKGHRLIDNDTIKPIAESIYKK